MIHLRGPGRTSLGITSSLKLSVHVKAVLVKPSASPGIPRLWRAEERFHPDPSPQKSPLGSVWVRAEVLQSHPSAQCDQKKARSRSHQNGADPRQRSQRDLETNPKPHRVTQSFCTRIWGQFHATNERLPKPVWIIGVFIELEGSNGTELGSHTALAAWLPGTPSRGARSEPPPAPILTERFAELWMLDPNGFQPLQQLR